MTNVSVLTDGDHYFFLKYSNKINRKDQPKKWELQIWIVHQHQRLEYKKYWQKYYYGTP